MKKHFLLTYLLIFTFASLAQTQFGARIEIPAGQEPKACHQSPYKLIAQPQSDTLTYVWYKNGGYLGQSENNFIDITEAGSYRVDIRSKEFVSVSNEVAVGVCEDKNGLKGAEEMGFGMNGNSLVAAVINPFITPALSYQTVFCPNVTSLTLNANPTNATYTYQWLSSSTENGTYTEISNATASTYTTTTVGYYKVSINDGTTPKISPAYRVRNGATATLTTSNNTNSITISAGQSVNLNANFTGTGPWLLGLYNYSNYNKHQTYNTQQSAITITPETSSQYVVNNFFDANGIGCPLNNTICITVGPPPSFTYLTPSVTTVCPGNIFEIPVTYSGTWSSQENTRLDVQLRTTTNGFVSNSPVYGLFKENSIKYLIPPGIPNGTYKIMVGATYPNLLPVLSPYTIEVVNSSCTPNQALILNNAGGTCTPNLLAFPNGSGFTFQWFKNGAALPGITFPAYFADTPGNYSVQISNSSIGYNATSSVRNVSAVLGNSINTYSNSNLCNGTVNLSTNYTGQGYEYQWFRNYLGLTSFIPLETNSSISVNTPGSYSVKIWNGSCQLSNFGFEVAVCPPQITSTNPVICGTNTQATLTTNATGTFQWSYASNQFGSFTSISGATNNSHTTSTIGYYKVAVTSNGSIITSDPFWVSTTPYAQLRNATGGTETVTIAQGGNTNLTLNFFGQPPFTANLYSGNINIPINSSGNQFIQNVIPETSRYFNISNVKHGCGTNTGYGQNSVLVRVTPEPDFTITSLSAATCPGGTMQITLNKTGNWGAETGESIYVNLYTSSNTYVTNLGAFSGNIFNVNLPVNLTVGQSYYFSISPQVPYLPTKNSLQFTVNSGCAAPVPAIFTVQNSTCTTNPILNGSPIGNFNYQWYKNGVAIPEANYENYYVPNNGGGSYTLQVQNSTGYNSTSPAKTVTINNVQPQILSSTSSLCGNTTSINLASNVTVAGYTYEWSKSSLAGGSLSSIPGTTNLTSINVSEVGRYYLTVNNGTCNTISPIKYITFGGSTANLLNSSNTSETVFITPGATENLKVNLTGTGPWEVAIQENYLNTKLYTTSSSPLILPVSPSINTRYAITSLKDQCGFTPSFILPNNAVYVNVSANPVITLTAPSNLNVCKGNVISIPYTITGTLSSSSTVNLYLADATGGQSRNIYSYAIVPVSQNTGVLDFYIPINTVSKQYSVLSYVNYPSSNIPKFSDFLLNVGNSGCVTPPSPIINQTDISCENVYLRCNINGAFSSSNTYSYKWYKNGVELIGQTNETLITIESGDYTVRVTNSTTGYDQTSPIKTVTLNRIIPQVTAINSVLCGANTSTTLSANFTGAGYTYQWYKARNFSDGSIEQMPIFGATASTYTATSVGEYSIKVYDGSCIQNSVRTYYSPTGQTLTSTPFRVTATPNATLTNSLSTNNPIDIAPGATENLKVQLAGLGPWNIKLYDGADTTYHVAATSPFSIPVSPSQSKNYRLVYVSNSCGVGTVSGSVLVNVTPSPSFNLGTPGAKIAFATQANATVCAGSTFNIPYTISGNWGPTRNMAVELYNTANVLVAGSRQTGFTANPIPYFVPANLAAGSYKIKLYSNDPFIAEGVLSSYTLDVVTTVCTSPQAVINMTASCASAVLTALPIGAGYTYQWYKNGVAINLATAASFKATASGDYTVIVQNNSGYNQTSAIQTINLIEINTTITTSGSSICDGVGSMVLSSPNTGGSFSYQWYYSPTTFGHTAIAGATNSSYTATIAGNYYVIIQNGACQQKSNSINTCQAAINFVSQTVCLGSSVTVPIQFMGIAGNTLTLQLVNASDNTLVESNLSNIVTKGSSAYNITINLPNTIGAGTYKFKIIAAGFSLIGNGILTVNSQSTLTAPSVSTSINSVNGPTSVTVSAVGCVGNLTWSISDEQSQLFPTFTTNISQTTTFSAICTDPTTGCKSPAGSKTVTGACNLMYSTKSGSWTDPTVWSCGRAPIATDGIIIEAGHIIEVTTGNYIIKTLLQKGALTLVDGAVLNLNQ